MIGFVQILGGLALLIYGIRLLSAGMEKLTGDQIQRWLDRVTPPFDNSEPMDIFELMPSQEAARHLEYINGYEAGLRLRHEERNAAAALARFRQLQALYKDDRAIAWQIQELS